MDKKQEYRRIYRVILDTLELSPTSRAALIGAVIEDTCLSEFEKKNSNVNSKFNIIRSMAGTIINEMQRHKIIELDAQGLYRIIENKPIAIRIERCEEEIVRLLSESKKTRNELRDALVQFFGTDATDTMRDDNKLFTYIGQILKRLTAEGLIRFDGQSYSISPARSAEIRNHGEIVSLKADFLSLLHSKGGEFFEVYFMNLLSKYFVRLGKIVTECHTTGGASDGGIDGIAKTVDSLGFRETVMVQTKNRLEESSETDVRGFYGAVCARHGSRGIFATTSDFHPVAIDFLNSIDNCVGVNGSKIFSMACDTGYGIRREGGKLIIDRDVL